LSEALKQSLDLALFWEYRAVLLSGLLFNAGIFACAGLAALVLGLAAALLRVSRARPLRWIGTVYVELFRNAPDYVMLVWVHFVLRCSSALRCAPASSFTPSYPPSSRSASCTFAETFRTGIQSIPKGNIEAGRAVGMSEALILRRITLPQVVRRMLPEGLNIFISLFKATTIVSLIAVPDLMYRVSMVTQQEMQPLPLYTGAALTYFVIILVVATLLRWAGERWRRNVLA
jgi:polar amino acid transport system permease protein